MDEEVKQWLGRVNMWNETIYGRVNETEMADLRSFLQRLDSQLHQWDNLSVVSQNLPSVGQLLRCLCSNELLMLHEADYQLIMRCVLAFYTNQPCNLLEEKAQKWAQSQVRHGVSYYKEIDPCIGVAESISCPVSSYNHVASLTVIESIVRDLNRVPLTKWDSIANCLVPSTMLSNDTLMNVSELCLPLITSDVDGIAPLIECLLCCHGNGTDDALSLAFLEAVMKSQESAYTEKSCLLELSYEAQVSLWTRYLPSFESEFLHLVEGVVPLLAASSSSETTAKQLVLSRHIPRACAENPSLLAAVNTWLELLMQQASGGTFVFMLSNLICQCLREYQSSLPAQYHCCYSRHSEIDSLSSQLQVTPHELPVGLVIHHINNISNCLCRLHSADRSTRLRAWFVLAKCQAWYYAVVRLLFWGTMDSHPPCLNIVAWYNIPLSPYDDHQQYKAQLSDVVTSLRGLCSKSGILSRDLMYAFSHLVGPHSHGTRPNNIARPLCMLFAVYARGAHLIMQDIINMATRGDNPSAISRFIFLLDSVEFALGAASGQKHQSWQAPSSALTQTLWLFKRTYDEDLKTGSYPVSLDMQESLQGRYNRVCKLLS